MAPARPKEKPITAGLQAAAEENKGKAKSLDNRSPCVMGLALPLVRASDASLIFLSDRVMLKLLSFLVNNFFIVQKQIQLRIWLLRLFLDLNPDNHSASLINAHSPQIPVRWCRSFASSPSMGDITHGRPVASATFWPVPLAS